MKIGKIKIGKKNIYNYMKEHFTLPKCYKMEYSHSQFMEVLKSKEIEIFVTEEEIEVKTYIYIEKEDMQILKNKYIKENNIKNEIIPKQTKAKSNTLSKV